MYPTLAAMEQRQGWGTRVLRTCLNTGGLKGTGFIPYVNYELNARLYRLRKKASREAKSPKGIPQGLKPTLI